MTILYGIIRERASRGWPYPVSARTIGDYTKFWIQVAEGFARELDEQGLTETATEVRKMIAVQRDLARVPTKKSEGTS